jgi:adenine-specific DNA-methyltransferase
MELTYNNKRSLGNILRETQPANLETTYTQGTATRNKLIKGDNLQVMKALLQDYSMAKKIDLVYIDPPFATNNVFKHSDERTSTISPGNSDAVAYSDTLKGAEFLEFLRERLAFIRELMADHASIYLHIDYKIGHYIKLVMDEIFGEKNFRNDITRIKCNPKNFARKGYSNIKDLILFYTKSDQFIWNEPSQEVTEQEIERLFPKTDKDGRRYTTTPLHAPGETANGNTGKAWRGLMPPRGRHWRYDPAVLDELDAAGLIEWSGTGNPRKIIYADEAKAKGKRLQDIWEFKDPAYPSYPTEKNIELLKTIIRTSSEAKQMVFDCFCGSGTTLVAAEQLARTWIGIDNSDIAIQTAVKRLGRGEGLFNLGPEYEYIEQKSVTTQDNNARMDPTSNESNVIRLG